jgi:hypothetical protein
VREHEQEPEASEPASQGHPRKDGVEPRKDGVEPGKDGVEPRKNSVEPGRESQVRPLDVVTIAPLTKPAFAELEGGAYSFAARIKANNRTRNALAIQAEGLKGTRDFKQAQDYVAAEKAWLVEKLKLLDETEAQGKKRNKTEASHPPRHRRKDQDERGGPRGNAGRHQDEHRQARRGHAADAPSRAQGSGRLHLLA